MKAFIKLAAASALVASGVGATTPAQAAVSKDTIAISQLLQRALAGTELPTHQLARYRGGTAPGSYFHYYNNTQIPVSVTQRGSGITQSTVFISSNDPSVSSPAVTLSQNTVSGSIAQTKVSIIVIKK